MKLKQLIFAAIFIGSCILSGFAQTDREKGIERFNKGDFQGAVEILSQVVKSNENDIIALYNLGLAFEKLNQIKDAVRLFEKTIYFTNDIVSKAIEKTFGGNINENNKETLSESLKKYTEELEIGYLSIQKFSELNPKDSRKKQWQEKFTNIEAFAPNSELAKTFSDKKRDTPMQITKKSSPRGNGANGVIRARVLFMANGKIGSVILVNSLTKSSNESVLDAAKKIKFKPAMVNGKPISIWKLIEYSFRTY